MKRFIAVVLSGVMLATVFLSGCNTTPGKSEEEESEITTEATTTETEPEPAGIDPVKHKQLADLYVSKVPDKRHIVQAFDDSIRGEASYSVDEDHIYFSYGSYTGESRLTLNVNTMSNTVHFDFDLSYGDTRYYGTNAADSLGLDGIESFIDAAIAKDASVVRIYDESAWEANQDKIKTDLSIVYSRFIKLAGEAFPEVGFGLEDTGISLGDKYRSVDPTQLTSEEIEVKNEHKFENGVCTDCGMLWVDYYYDTIGKLGHSEESSGWHSLYGQDSEYMFAPGDYVQYTSYGKGSGNIYFQHGIMKDPESTMAGSHDETCTLVFQQNKKELTSYLVFEYEEGMHSVGQGIVDFKFKFYMSVEAKDNDYSKVFESKETLKKNAELYLFVKGDDGVGTDVWSSMKDDEIRKMFDEIEFSVYFTKDEFIDMIWNDYERIFNSMDKGMIWMDTSLADAGIKWKKKAEN